MDKEAQNIVAEIVAERELVEEQDVSLARCNFVRLYKSGITTDTEGERDVMRQEMLAAMWRLGESWGCGRAEVVERLDF